MYLTQSNPRLGVGFMISTSTVCSNCVRCPNVPAGAHRCSGSSVTLLRDFWTSTHSATLLEDGGPGRGGREPHARAGGGGAVPEVGGALPPVVHVPRPKLARAPLSIVRPAVLRRRRLEIIVRAVVAGGDEAGAHQRRGRDRSRALALVLVLVLGAGESRGLS